MFNVIGTVIAEGGKNLILDFWSNLSFIDRVSFMRFFDEENQKEILKIFESIMDTNQLKELEKVKFQLAA
jgi:hypothetical protein